MPGNDKTIYKICREQAGYTQEQAAELMHISVRMLCRYESGETVVPNDVADSMVRLYNDNFLAVEHLRQSSEAAARILPAVDRCSIQTGAMRLFNRMGTFLSKRPDLQLLQIAEDGVIDEAERQELDAILDDLEELVKVFTDIRLAAERGR